MTGPGTTSKAPTSPSIDASTLAHGELKFRRWLNTAQGGIAYVQVQDGGIWQTIWNSSSTGSHSDSSWALQTLDVSAYADGNSSFRVRFLQKSGLQQTHAAGWNVDRFLVRDGSLPAFDVCGGCIGAPTFGGAEAATDLDPCAGSGIRIDWTDSPAWGSGSSGTFAVYRDSAPGFVPGPGNLVASGVTGSSWTDATPPADVTLYYVVRAENDETCGAGPGNGGLTDENLVYVQAADETAQVLPGAVGETVLADDVNDAHVRVTWSPVADAASYRVYRSTTGQGPFELVADVVETSFDDRDRMGDSANAFYKVVAADACGNEGP